MRFSENWLREFVPEHKVTADLVRDLTMAGLEVAGVSPVAEPFSGVVVAEILSAEPHPKADRLRVCRVDAGGETLQIVCGAPNARPGLKVPLALVGADLPGGLCIAAQPLRGVESFGMLCSAKELGIDEDASGLMELPGDAPVGQNLREYLGLDDQVIEVDLTPNRADCLSVEGIAREVALLKGVALRSVTVEPCTIDTNEQMTVTVECAKDCPNYLGQTLIDVDRSRPTPLFIRERLRRSGLRPLNLIVDITNYVLLELGQPLHAFDAEKISGGVRVRRARAGEDLILLNGESVSLEPEVLVIADEVRPLALAGIMGGRDSAVGDDTRRIFLESAFFDPEVIQGRARRYGLNTDASHRFERGVSAMLQSRALHRAMSLMIEYGGGRAGPVVQVTAPDQLPRREAIELRRSRILALLGIEIDPESIERILLGLGMVIEVTETGWQVTPPAARFDVTIEADLIEEIARIHGYNRLPSEPPRLPARMLPASEQRLTLDRLKDLLVDRGYQEAITYSFTAAEIQRWVEPAREPLALLNPLSAELAVMRTSLWPGLLDAALRNRHRQQVRIRLFESGLCFLNDADQLEQRSALAFLALGPVAPEQWGSGTGETDFFDVRGDLEALVSLTGRQESLRLVAESHPALHPGQSAAIWLEDQQIGRIGMVHPALEAKLGFEQPIFLVQLDLDALLGRRVPRFKGVSRLPSVRRDMAIVVAEALPVAQLLETVRAHAGAALQEAVVFDVYQGVGLEPGLKSVALGLTWQDPTDTLVDEQIDQWFGDIIEALSRTFDAKLRA